MFGLSSTSARTKGSANPSEKLEVELPSGKTATVTWKKVAKSRSVRIKIGPMGATVTSPTRAPKIFVQNFLENQAAWLETHLSKHKPSPTNEIWYRGSAYKIVINTDGEHAQRVKIDQDTCVITPVTPNQASATKVLERWLQVQAGEVATPLLQDLAKKMGVEVPQLRFKQTTSRWGSCTQHGAIMLNWRLIHAPDEVFRYVIVHELAHRVHMNHSKAFWDLVKRFDPSYPIHQGWLKRNASKCTTPQIEL